MEELIDKVSKLNKTITSDINKRKNIKKKIKEIKNNLKKKDFFTLRKILTSKTIQNLTYFYPDSKGVVDELNAICKKEIDHYSFRFNEYFTEECKKYDITIDGKYPRYVFNKIITINIDPTKILAEVNKNKLKTLDVQEIVKVMLEEKKRLLDRDFDPQSFIDNLFSSYKAALAKHDKKIGDYVGIFDLHKHYIFYNQSENFFKKPTRSNFREYPIDFFQADMHKLLSAGVKETSDGFRIEFSAVRDPKNALLIIDGYGHGRNIGLVLFR